MQAGDLSEDGAAAAAAAVGQNGMDHAGVGGAGAGVQRRELLTQDELKAVLEVRLDML